MARLLIALPISAGLLYVILCAVLFFAQTRLIFPAGPPSARTPADAGFPTFESVTLHVGAFTSEAWFIPNDHARGTILFSHGNGETMAERLEMANSLYHLGFNIFLYEYGGYAKSTGAASESRCYGDIDAAWQYLTETRQIQPDKIVVFGESLGTGPSVDLASRAHPGALILLSPFTSLTDIAVPMLPYFPVRLLLINRFESTEKIGRVHSPVLIMHGRADTVVPFAQGQKLFALANEPKSFVELPDGHGAYYAAPEAFTAAVSAFITPLYPSPSSS